jgi:hypothetical protein
VVGRQYWSGVGDFMKAGFLGAFLAGALVAGCGGGGGGGGTTTGGGATPPPAVQITQANARPVGAHASDAVQNTNATQGSTGLITGVQVEGAGAAGSPSPLLLAQVVRSLADSGAGMSLATGVAVSESLACDGGRGSITISGSVAHEDRLVAGDTLSIGATNCSTIVGGQSTTLHGALSISVTGGQMPASGAYPFHVVMRIVATNLSVTTGGVTDTSHGDLTLDWNATSDAVQTLVATGSSLTNGTIGAGSARSTTWKNFNQSIALNGATISGSLSAAVETNSPRLGSTGGSYTVSTPTVLSWSTGTDTPTSGVVLVVGAANSQLRITFTGTGATLEVDADGNGSFESTVNSTAAELRSFL